MDVAGPIDASKVNECLNLSRYEVFVIVKHLRNVKRQWWCSTYTSTQGCIWPLQNY